MRKISIVLSAVLLLTTASAWAQMAQGDIGRVYVTTPKNARDYEAGRKRHMAFHAKQNDTWAWYTWEVVAGDNAGQYITGTFGHNWADFDVWSEKLEAADTADAAINLGPYSAGGGNGFYRYRADMSIAPPPATPAPYSSVTFFVVRDAQKFARDAEKVKNALQKANYPIKSAWWQLAVGGEPHFALVGERKAWADFAPPPKLFDQIVLETYGKEEGGALLKSLSDNIVSTRSEVLKYRPDLSYVPKK